MLGTIGKCPRECPCPQEFAGIDILDWLKVLNKRVVGISSVR